MHVRVACPPLMYPCDFGISTSNSEDLCARKFIKEWPIENMAQLQNFEAWITDLIVADSVKFNSLEIFVSALGIAKENLCTKCWDGISPVKG